MLSPNQKHLFAGKFADFGNIAAGSLVFGALIREEAFTQTAVLLGLALLLAAYVLAVVLSRPA